MKVQLKDPPNDVKAEKLLADVSNVIQSVVGTANGRNLDEILSDPHIGVRPNKRYVNKVSVNFSLKNGKVKDKKKKEIPTYSLYLLTGNTHFFVWSNNAFKRWLNFI